MSRRAVECECREVLPVLEGECRELKCSCGRFVVVPSDEEFDGKSVLLSAATVERRIQRMVSAEQLPPHRERAWCGALDAEPVDTHLVCEQSRTRTTGGIKSRVSVFFLLLLLTPIIIFPTLSILLLILLLRPQEGGVEVLGRENTVPVPLCACETCGRSLSQPRRSNVLLLVAVLAVIAVAIVLATLSLIVGLVVGVVSLLAVLVGVVWRRSSVAKRWQQTIKDKLAQVPVYAQLLREYPHSLALLPTWVWLNRRPWSMSNRD